MKVLIHNNARKIVKVQSHDGQTIPYQNENCTSTLWNLAERFPEELIVWCEERVLDNVKWESFNLIFHHDLIMASYSYYSQYVSSKIGYVDQMPFAEVNNDVLYGTWRMSTDVGGIKGKVLLEFKDLYPQEYNLGFLLNSIAKIGLENGLFCYSAPNLVELSDRPKALQTLSKDQDLFKFVYAHYTTVWISVLFWCLIRRERKIPFLSYMKAFFSTKRFKKVVKLNQYSINSTLADESSNHVDVIIPTLGRKEEVKNVLFDLRDQTLVPYQVILIEQNPDENSISELDFIEGENWPFKLNHIFTHKIGVCNARNLGLKKTVSDWVFLCDDDNRLSSEVLKKSLAEIRRLGVNMISTAYRQPKEPLIFKRIKQWGTFGAGNSIIRKNLLKGIYFSPAYEHGYGEDKDFGMQLRKNGCDIIYNPFIEIIHLKAPSGGFRAKQDNLWDSDNIEPKPSPTVMALILNHYSSEQAYGYKISLILKFFPKQKIKNPFIYIHTMNKRWKRSLYWGAQLLNKTS